MPKFRKKPVVIEAELFDGSETSARLVCAFASASVSPGWDRVDHINIVTLEGAMRADKGDWVIKGVNGEFYPCKPDIFAATYEHVE